MSGIAGINTLVSKEVLIPKIGFVMKYRKEKEIYKIGPVQKRNFVIFLSKGGLFG